MKRRNFIRNTGLGIAGLALSNSIYGKDLSTRKSLNVFILMSGGVCFNDIIGFENNPSLKLFDDYANMTLNCRTNVNYTGQSMEHTAAMIAVLQALKDDSVKNIFISNKHSEVTHAVKNSLLPISVIHTNSKGILEPYRNDAAIFEKAYAYFEWPNNLNLILNLEDTDIAHCNSESYFEVLAHYHLEIKKLCNFLNTSDLWGNFNTTINVASTIGRNGFKNELHNELNQGGTDHYDPSARALFSLSMSCSATSQISFDYSSYDSKDLFSSLYLG